ncbi:hypothetical protein Cs7R123_06830 [Catellatospora sp. TT07R-123]|uniref:hypothetical protein n=1 Tax=Catellatospora sp. TT07R-123 TaxID=2733863 RepID=UPI001B12AFFA|nr:hypothetical protein [Catellatospora sp. TT07R-123]GHJ43341.1 hypothetical protein Cs7R123_06830 [Catellatospora sp. TT07R-123]
MGEGDRHLIIECRGQVISRTVAAAHCVGPAASRVFDKVMDVIAVRFTRIEPQLVVRDF